MWGNQGKPQAGHGDMIPNRDSAYLDGLVRNLCTLPYETEWVEFKVNRDLPRDIGEYVSALSNGGALNGKDRAYMLWGIEDGTHVVVGTEFAPATAKVGNEPLENWLRRQLTPRIDFCFHEVEVDQKQVVILEIEPASQEPVGFQGNQFIRVGSVKKNIKDHPEKARALWRIFDRASFEDGIAAGQVSDVDVLGKLHYPEYFNLLALPLPDGRAAILDALRADRLITPCDAGGWNVTNLGAILFAKNLRDFPRIWRKALRVVQYQGNGRTEAQREREFHEGYAVVFDAIVDYIMTLVPANEVIEGALRREIPMFPRIAVRELVANALIHQDFSVTGAGPTVEIFDTRIEITNPGEALVDTERFLDSPPTSRNERLASLLRRFNICEERGSGIDKVVLNIEMLQMPAPLFETPAGFTRTFLFAHKPLSDMDRPERVRACYLHACLRYVTNQPMNNASVRERFGIDEPKAATASRFLREALDAGYIVIGNPNVGSRSRTYLPFWANRREIRDQVL